MARLFDKKLFVKEVRKKKGTSSLKKIGSQVGTSDVTLWRILHGNTPHIDTALKICDWLNRDLSYFIIND